MQGDYELLIKFCSCFKCARCWVPKIWWHILDDICTLKVSVQSVKDMINCLQDVFVSPIFRRIYVMSMM